jgi:hypothetical protein
VIGAERKDLQNQQVERTLEEVGFRHGSSQAPRGSIDTFLSEVKGKCVSISIRESGRTEGVRHLSEAGSRLARTNVEADAKRFVPYVMRHTALTRLANSEGGSLTTVAAAARYRATQRNDGLEGEPVALYDCCSQQKGALDHG